MKIYTKKGDSGETDLLVRRVKKNDLHIEVNGQIDEVMATILVAKQHINDQKTLEILDQIHYTFYQMAYEIALDDINQCKVFEKDVDFLENEIDSMDEKLEKLTKFIQLDENPAQAWLNMCRVKSRALERVLVELDSHKKINPYTLKYVNRLSDFFFTLGRSH
ncbi:ATP:cob(I)alamin adenosyltransferase [Tenericutes bacterium MO-XQ]|nr:ATP:cob(I)alamin adenosyltransferase [Tenericutes bacterium MO-XQ]